MVEALLCELEGVVVDCAPLRDRALREALVADGLGATSESLVHQAGTSTASQIREVLAAAGCAADETRADVLLLAARWRFAELAARGISLRPGARELLLDARSHAPIALVTRASRAEADLLLSLADLSDVFDCRIAAEDSVRGKPDAAPYHKALDRLARRRGIESGRCLALEDGSPGARAARAAGIPCIVVGAVPAHDALEADAGIASLVGARLDSLANLLAHRTRSGGAPV